ncbi:MAG: M13 family metallopeptidase N-terminal domain-containing protein, partial [Telluria sp.]
MNTRWTPLKSAIALALCGASLALTPAHATGQATPPAAKAAAAAPQVLPGDDFFAYANGDWLAKTEIPADRSSWGAFAAMAETSNERIVKLIEAQAANKAARGEPRKVADYYTAFMDEAGIEAKGSAPLKPVLARIDAIKDKAALTRALGASRGG